MVGSVEWYNIKAPYEGGMLPGYVSAEYITEITSTSTGNLAVDMEDVSVNTGALNSTAMRMVGIPTLEKSLSQTVNIAGKTNDVFVISGWGCGNPLPMNQAEEGENQRHFGLELEFTYTDGTKKPFYADFMSDSNKWQYVNKVIIAEKDYSAIKASYVYNYNANNAYFDGLSVFKDEYWPSFTYDTNGNIVSCTDAKKQKTEFTYDTNNNITNIEMPSGAEFTYTYGDPDHPHRITEAVSATNKKYVFEYDEKGNVTSYKIVDNNNNANYIKYSYEYTDNYNYPERNMDYFGNSVIFDYNHETGNLESVTDVNGNKTTYGYDEMGKLLSVRKENYASGQLTDIIQSYTYENDRIKKIRHNGMDYTFSYDEFGNVTEVKAGTQTVVTNTYKMKGTQLDKALVGNGQGARFEYDEYDRMIKKLSVKSDGTSVLMFEYIYDNEGRLAYVIDHVNNDQIHYTYSLSGKLECMEHKNGQVFRYIYDMNDCLVSIESGGANDLTMKTVNYEYDDDLRETKTTTIGGKTLTTTYDALGRMTSQMFDITNMHATTYGYLEAADGSETPVIGLIRPGSKEFSYQYHDDGNIRQITTPWTSEAYEYDALGQLTRANNNDTGETILYAYDAGMNMISEEVYNYTTAGDVTGDPIRQRGFTYDSVWKDRMLTCGGKALTYDAAGNLTSYDGTTFTWSNGRQLTGVTTAGGVNAVYNYDHIGKRVSKTVGSVKTEYFYSGDLLLRQKSPTADMQFTYDSVGNLVAVMYNGVEYYYVKNLQGDIIGLVNDQSTMVVDYSYYLWGDHRSVVGQLASTLGQDNPFRYRGYYYDAETGLYHVGSRYYSPELCRFICPDKTSVLHVEPMKLTSKNLYSYCDNNPVSKLDSNGEIAMAAIGAIAGKVIAAAAPYVLGAVANIAATGIVAKATGEDFTFKDALAAGAIGALGAANNSIVITASKVGDVVYTAYSTWKDTGNIRVAAYAGVISVFSNSIDAGDILDNLGYGANLDDYVSKAMISFDQGIVNNVASGKVINNFYETVQEEVDWEKYRP